MSSATLHHHDTREEPGAARHARAERQLLVATDGSPGSDGALRAAAAIAARTRQAVRLLGVSPPLPLATVEVHLARSADADAAAREGLAESVRGQVERLGIGDSWPLETLTGDPAALIAAASRDADVSLVLMGLGGHGTFDQLLGDETVLQVLRLGSGPVLAVDSGWSGPPSRVLAALDFSASSGNAAMLGADLMRADGTMTLAHVVSRDVDSANWAARNTAYRGSVGRAFDRIVAELGTGSEVAVERRVLAGDPAKALLSLATELDADLIATGSHGRDFLTRLLVGSVSTRLVRGAGCSVLIAPPDDGPGYVEELAEERGRFAFYEWRERLEEFTRRNAGRRAVLEVIDPQLGARVQERGVRFVGAAFDHTDAHVHLMFENDAGVHATRGIAGITAVQLLRDRHGRDRVLRIAHGRGQTLLTLER